jgi:A/G-specific adenine glycosylase
MWDKLIQWSLTNFQHLPWRKNRSLYTTLVSEIMLQQTTVPTVMKHFDRFILRFKDLKTLAKAKEEEVLGQWTGLGYYRRARSLRNAAVFIEDHFQGKFPLEMEDLLSIPGIGPYTASALRAIGADLLALPVDANLERVLSRVFSLSEELGLPLKKKLNSLHQDNNQIIHHYSPRHLSEALMDLGREICSPKNPSCHICPVQENCLSFKEGKVHLYPVINLKNQLKKTQKFELILLRLLVKKGSKVFVYQKEDHQWLKDQWELPTIIISTADFENHVNLSKQYPFLSDKILTKHKSKIQSALDELPLYKSSITKYKITNYILETDDLNFNQGFISSKNFQDQIEKGKFINLNCDKTNFSLGPNKAIQIV